MVVILCILVYSVLVVFVCAEEKDYIFHILWNLEDHILDTNYHITHCIQFLWKKVENMYWNGIKQVFEVPKEVIDGLPFAV